MVERGRERVLFTSVTEEFIFCLHSNCFDAMLGDDEDVFDSVTWETPAHPTYTSEPPSTGPGFRQSTADSSEGPHDPKWEGYLITSVKDPVKELAETKDAYVSYLVSANVRRHIHPAARSHLCCRPICLYSQRRHHRLVDDSRTLSF